VNNLQVTSYPLKRLSLLLITTLLYGCSTTSSLFDYGDSRPTRTPVPVEERGKSLDSAKQWLELAARSGPPRRQEYQLRAAELLLRANQHEEAKQLLASIDTASVDFSLQLQQGLLSSEIALIELNARTALKWLRFPEDYPIPAEQQARIHTLRAQAHYLAGNWRASSAERVALEPYLSDPLDIDDNHQIIWLTLSLLGDDQLNATTEQEGSTLSGWMELVAISRSSRFQSKQLESRLQSWQMRYPIHPGLNQRVPDMLTQARESSLLEGPIALLLPLSGKHATAGATVRDGFLAAHYADNPEGRDNPLLIYDTAESPLAAYRAALRDGAKMVVGPLRKEAVAELAQLGAAEVPTLALNHALSSTPEAFYQFGLSPEDEVLQLADQALMDGYARAIALVPSGSWGDRLLATLQNRWELFGGELLEVQRYDPEGNDFSPPIRALLDTDQSLARQRAVTRATGSKLKFEPRRRQDADIVFVLAFPRQARLIRPQLKFHYLGKLPIYATSHIYTGFPDRGKDRDMDGIQFCDMPWTLGASQQHNPLRQQLQQIWPKRMKGASRLFALGIDAYRIAPLLNVLASRPGTRIEGETGTLYLDERNSVRRVLRWASFVHGEPRPLAHAPTPTTSFTSPPIQN